jgi:methylenetetrahydrofolate dehydrogenase (NADP+)/methenyltetrahydrofolate cyclohydrolase
VSAQRLEGRPVAESIWRRVQEQGATFAAQAARPACLGLVGGTDESAAAYARQIERQFSRRGLTVSHHTADGAHLTGVLSRLSAEPSVDGILLLTPLPPGADPVRAALAIDPSKDVDGQHPASLGRLGQRRGQFAPATALGGVRLLEHYAIPLRGQRVVVVGRSPVVGLPLALLLLDRDATVTICHSKTPDLPGVTRQADILCVAVGRAGLIGPEHVRHGAVVLDFGTNAEPDGTLRGDVQTAAVAEVASAITPVPGGTGPTTVAVLAEQTVAAAEARLSAQAARRRGAIGN